MSASPNEAAWWIDGMHPAAILVVYVGLAVAALVLYSVLETALPVSVPVERILSGVGVLAGVLLGWHLRRLYDGGGA